MQPLIVLRQEGFPSGHAQHNITYAHIVIARCQYCSRAQVEIFDHDCFDYEAVWDQGEWYVLNAEDGAAVYEWVDRCPSPLSAACNCAAHRRLRDICLALPATGWSTALEADEHVHSIPLKIG
jgi:hypothetical protein